MEKGIKNKNDPVNNNEEEIKDVNKRGLYWAKLSSSWDWTLLLLICTKLMNKTDRKKRKESKRE